MESKETEEIACFEAWLMGSRGENAGELERLAVEAIRDTAAWRRHLFPDDPIHITEALKDSGEFRRDTRRLREEFHSLLDYLKRSVPAFSRRYQAHMGWDLLLPGTLGYFAGMLHGSNNVAYEGSPATTVLETLACRDLCRMLGYGRTGGVRPWGHLTGGATLSNIESLWAVRNLKHLPFAIRDTLDGLEAELSRRRDEAGLAALEEARRLPVPCFRGGESVQVPFRDLDEWELLNLGMDAALELPVRMAGAVDVDPRDRAASRFELALSARGLNVVGLGGIPAGRAMPRILAAGTRHYSLEKAAGLLGLGQASLVNIFVDESARMDLQHLEARLRECLEGGIPVLAVVATLGTTEEGAVDPVEGILELRRRFRSQGLEFAVHVDAAWGGYHASMVREDFEMQVGDAVARTAPETVAAASAQAAAAGARPGTPCLGLSAYVKRQYLALPGADSIAVDPHKQGHIPFPAGAVCYRNSALRDLVKFSAPYLGEVVPQGIRQAGGRSDVFMGVFGVEGSRPGAAAAAVFLTHRLVRPSRSGYGRLIGMEMFNCKKVFAMLAGLGAGEGFLTVPLAGTAGREEIRRAVDDAGNDDLAKDPGLLAAMEEMGPDLNIVTYLFNFRSGEGYNQDPGLLACFNQLIYNRLRLDPERPYAERKLVVSQTVLFGHSYGPRFLNSLLARLRMGLRVDEGNCAGLDLIALRSTEANPWLTDSRAGSFLPEMRAQLRASALEALADMELIQGVLEALRRERSPLSADPLLPVRLAALGPALKESVLRAFPDRRPWTSQSDGGPEDPASCTYWIAGLFGEALAAAGRESLPEAALRRFDESRLCPS